MNWVRIRALHRLTSFKRGTLNATDDAISGTPLREQAWELDHLGNWTKITSKADDVLERPYERRTHDTSNKIAFIDPLLIGETNPWYYQPGYNATGDLTNLTAANDGSPDHQFIYDFRDRLTQVDGSAVRFYCQGARHLGQGPGVRTQEAESQEVKKPTSWGCRCCLLVFLSS